MIYISSSFFTCIWSDDYDNQAVLEPVFQVLMSVLNPNDELAIFFFEFLMLFVFQYMLVHILVDQYVLMQDYNKILLNQDDPLVKIFVEY